MKYYLTAGHLSNICEGMLKICVFTHLMLLIG